MKTYKFIDLLREIKEGKLESRTKLKDDQGNIYEITDTNNLIEDEHCNPITIEFPLEDLLYTEFTVIKENLDIQDISEIYSASDTDDKINEIIRAIKQLDRQINNN